MKTKECFVISVILIAVVVGLILISTANLEIPEMAVNLVWSG